MHFILKEDATRFEWLIYKQERSVPIVFFLTNISFKNNTDCSAFQTQKRVFLVFLFVLWQPSLPLMMCQNVLKAFLLFFYFSKRWIKFASFHGKIRPVYREKGCFSSSLPSYKHHKSIFYKEKPLFLCCKSTAFRLQMHCFQVITYILSSLLVDLLLEWFNEIKRGALCFCYLKVEQVLMGRNAIIDKMKPQYICFS